MKRGSFLLAAAISAASHVALGATATCAVDFTESGAVRFPVPASVGYAPSWTAAAADSCDLLLVTHVGQEQCATQTLVSAASVAGEHSLAVPADGSCAVRLVLVARSGGSVVGEIVKDVSLASVASAAESIYADASESKIDNVLAAGGTPMLVYSDTWTNGVASIMIDHVAYDLATKTLFSQSAPADGEFAFRPTGKKRRTYTCRLHFLDSLGAEIGYPLTATYTGILNDGFILSFR